MWYIERPKVSQNQQQTSLKDICADALAKNLGLSDIEPLLLEAMQVTPLVRKANKTNGVKLSFKPDRCRGYSNADGRIELGLQEVPTDVKKQFGFTGEEPDLDVKKRMFSHENMHHVLFYMSNHRSKFPYLENLLTNLKTIRTQKGKGLSSIGSIAMYNSPERQTAHEEDFVELFNRYCIHPGDFKKYLNFLVRDDETLLAEQNLYRISQELADRLFKAVSQSIGTFLKENNIVGGVL